MERSDIDILAGRCKTLKAGNDTIEIKEPLGEFYLESISKIVEVIQGLSEENPALAEKMMRGGKFNLLDVVKLRTPSNLVFELLAMVMPEGHDPPYTATWLKKNVGLRGLIMLLNATIEVIGVKEIADNFFVLAEKLEEAFPEMAKKVSTTMKAMKPEREQDSSET